MWGGDGGTDGLMYENAGVLRAVNVNWYDDGWNVNANSVENRTSGTMATRCSLAIVVFLLV